LKLRAVCGCPSAGRAMAAMNASATPFVPEAQGATEGPAPQAANQASGVEVETGGMSGVSIWRPQYKGRIRSFSDQKGFGFIDCPETLRAFGRDVFIHRFQYAECGCKVGSEVVFEVDLNKTGNPQARRVRLNEEASESWDMSSGMAAYNSGGMIYGGGMQQGMYGGVPGGMDAGMGSYNPYGYMDGRSSAYGGDSRMMSRGGQGQETDLEYDVEKSLRACSGSQDMWEIIEQYGHSFGKRHVITALYQLGLCRQYERRNQQATLTFALVDRLVLFPPRDLSAEDSVRVLWAMGTLDEVRDHANAHKFVMDLGEEAAKRYHEFSPSQMASFVGSLFRLVKTPEEDELVGKVTTAFSDYALGGTGALPRFPPDELAIWTKFLQDASQQAHTQGQHAQQGQQPPGSYPPWGKGAMPPYPPPGAYSGGPGMATPWPQMGGSQPPQGMPQQMGKGFPGMYPPAKGGKPGAGGSMFPDMYGGKPGFPDPAYGGKPGFPGMYGLPPGGKGKFGAPPDGAGPPCGKGREPPPGKGQMPAGFGGPSAGSDARMGGPMGKGGFPPSMGPGKGAMGPHSGMSEGGKPSMPPGPINMPPSYGFGLSGGKGGPGFGPGGSPGPKGGPLHPPGGRGPMGSKGCGGGMSQMG